MFMSFKFQKMSRANLSLMFLVYSVLMGMSLSFVLLVYTQASVFSTFVVTSGTFGLMALVGYTTNTDLTKFGSILFMALIGIILASVVNFFMHSGTLEYIISILGFNFYGAYCLRCAKAKAYWYGNWRIFRRIQR